MAVNFLIFVVDQLQADLLGCYRNPIAATPHIDGLARRGWKALESYVATPLCMPNRASLLTGRMPSAHGVRHNGIPLSLAARTFADCLREHGYSTSLVGKSHLQTITSRPPLQDPTRPRLPLDAERAYPGGYLQESAASWSAGECPLELPFYGFAHVELAIQHGDLPSGHYRQWLEREHPAALGLAGRPNALPTPEYELSRVGQAWRTRLPEELHPSQWVADRAIAQLQRAVGEGKPFLTYCSFPDPHSPYTPPGRYWDLYRPEDMTLPASYENRGEPPPHLAWLQQQRDEGRAVKDTMGCFAASPREVREAIALNLGSLAFIDHQVGRVLTALRELGLERDTVVIFTSDHGEFAGDHQLLLKGPLHYRSLIRTPLLWSEPGLAGMACDQFISTVDIAPTVLARAGVPGFNGMQGRSFLPLLRGAGGVEAREAIVIEEEGQRTSYGFDRPVRMRTLLTRRWRLSLYDGVAWGELYDRDADPLEHANLWNDASFTTCRTELMARLAREMLELADTSPTAKALA